MLNTCTGCWPITSIIFTAIALIEDSNRIVPNRATLNPQSRAKLSLCLCLEGYTTVTLAWRLETGALPCPDSMGLQALQLLDTRSFSQR